MMTGRVPVTAKYCCEPLRIKAKQRGFWRGQECILGLFPRRKCLAMAVAFDSAEKQTWLAQQHRGGSAKSTQPACWRATFRTCSPGTCWGVTNNLVQNWSGIQISLNNIRKFLAELR
jgi:hypothetical protein